MNLEMEYSGSDYTAQAKWQNPNQFGISYLQSIANIKSGLFSMGCEALHHGKQGLTMYSTGGRFETEKSVSTLVTTPAPSIAASYTQKIGNYCGLSTELMWQMSQEGLESQWTTGLEYRLRASMFRGNIDSNWKVSSLYEEALDNFTKFTLSAELDHYQKKYRFGFGVSMVV